MQEFAGVDSNDSDWETAAVGTALDQAGERIIYIGMNYTGKGCLYSPRERFPRIFGRRSAVTPRKRSGGWAGAGRGPPRRGVSLGRPGTEARGGSPPPAAPLPRNGQTDAAAGAAAGGRFPPARSL